MRQPVGTGIRFPARRRSRRRNRKTRRYRVSCRNLPVFFRKRPPQIVQKGSPFSCAKSICLWQYGARPPRMSSCRAFSAGRPLFRIGKGGFCHAWIHNLQTLLKNSANKGAIQYSHNETRPERPHGKERLSGNAPHHKRGIRFTMGLRRMGISLTAEAPFRTYCGRAGCGACGKRGADLAQMTRNTAKALGRTVAMRRGALGAQGVDSKQPAGNCSRHCGISHCFACFSQG